MKFTLILIALFSLANGANHLCWSVDQIATELFKLADTNANGLLSYAELQQELITDLSLSNDTCLTYHEFMSNWQQLFHDHHDTTHKFFSTLDVDNDNRLCFMEVAVHIVQYDVNPNDGQIQPVELNTFMHDMHPDSHQNGGNGHGQGC